MAKGSSLVLAVVAVLVVILFFALRGAPAPVDPVTPVTPAQPTLRQRAKAILDRAAPAVERVARSPAAKKGRAWASAEVNPAPICLGQRSGNYLTVAPSSAGACPSGTLLCPGLRCHGPIPSCVDQNGSPSCPVCADGGPRCKPGDYYRTDPGTWQAGPSGGLNSPYMGAASNFPYCTQLGEGCSWASINSGSAMVYAGRGEADPDTTTGYRIISSTGETYYQDAGWDNSASFDPAGLEEASAECLASCEQQALAPTVNNGVTVDGGYAYVYNAPEGNCDVYHLQGGMRVQGTADYVKDQQ